tara:strand:- start:122 stop:421 length:300 start_codon:yes stop_codon:yes gene_type:complete
MRRNLSEQTKQYNKKLRSNKKLAKKALKNCFKIKPAPGLKFLKDVPAGLLVYTNNCKAILIECNETSCVVIVTSCKNNEESYYMGRHRWAPLTEVEVLG